MSDEEDYHQLSQSIREAHSFSTPAGPTAYRPPGYPLFIAIVTSIFSGNQSVLIFQALLDCVICLLLYKIGLAVGGSTVGFTAMCYWAFFPSSVLMTGLLLSETLFTAILIGAVSIILIWPTQSILLGLMFGLGILIKPQMAVMAGVSLVWNLIGKRWKESIIIASAIGILVMPWIIRNAVVMDAPVLSTNGGMNFWIGNNPDANGSYKIPNSNPLDSISNEREQSNEGYRRGVRFLLTHPADAVILAGKKIAYLWSSQHYLLYLSRKESELTIPYRLFVQQLSFGSILILNVPYIILVIGGIAGFFLFPAPSSTVRQLFLTLILLWMGFHVLYFGAARFMYPLLPILVLTTSVGFHGRDGLKRLTLQQRMIASAIIVLFLVILIAEYAGTSF